MKYFKQVKTLDELKSEYRHLDIGKWNKPLKIVPKRERIQTSKGPERARRITA